ncbi:MAG: aspartate dehydrogenase [Tissierellia bacterium]|nr:aspartate dehydrogenase [Tissierellia bacterium]
MRKYTLAIMGSGSLGSIIGEVISTDLLEQYELLGVLSGRVENAVGLANKLNCKAYKDIDEMLLDKPDYVIEAASPSVIKNTAVKILENKTNLIVLSVGAFADEKFYAEVENTARENNCRVHMASGAVGGFDVLRSAMLMEDSSVSITTEKSPSSLKGAPALEDRKLSQDRIEEVFNGSAKEAIKLFPKNINVAVATALATIGVDDTKVAIRSVPGMKSNKHSIKLVGDTVKVTVEIDAKPSTDNPRSSTLAAWSVIALLKNLVSPITF